MYAQYIMLTLIGCMEMSCVMSAAQENPSAGSKDGAPFAGGLPLSTPYFLWGATGLASGVPLFLHAKKKMSSLKAEIKRLTDGTEDDRASAPVGLNELKKEFVKYKVCYGAAIALMSLGSFYALSGIRQAYLPDLFSFSGCKQFRAERRFFLKRLLIPQSAGGFKKSLSTDDRQMLRMRVHIVQNK